MKRLWKPWNLTPIWYALIVWAFTFVFMGLVSGDSPPSLLGTRIAAICLLLVVLFTLICVWVAVTTYSTAQRYLTELLLLYLSVVLLFANIYFWAVTLFDQQAAFYGMSSPWQWVSALAGRRMDFGSALLLALNCFHFSCMTATTVGYGDIYPVHWTAKLAADIEVLCSMGVLTVGLGRLFSRRPAQAPV